MSKTLFIILLLVVAILFAGSSTFGVLKNDNQSENRLDLSASNNPIMSGLDSILAGFTPNLNLEGQFCNNKTAKSRFSLTPALARCSIELCSECKKPGSSKSSSAELRRGKMIVYGSNITIYMRVTVEKDKKPDDCISNLPSRSGSSTPTLAVEYSPNKASSDSTEEIKCWIEQSKTNNPEISLSVQKGGGALILECLSCPTNLKNLTISIENE